MWVFHIAATKVQYQMPIWPKAGTPFIYCWPHLPIYVRIQRDPKSKISLAHSELINFLQKKFKTILAIFTIHGREIASKMLSPPGIQSLLHYPSAREPKSSHGVSFEVMECFCSWSLQSSGSSQPLSASFFMHAFQVCKQLLLLHHRFNTWRHFWGVRGASNVVCQSVLFCLLNYFSAGSRPHHVTVHERGVSYASFLINLILKISAQFVLLWPFFVAFSSFLFPWAKQ